MVKEILEYRSWINQEKTDESLPTTFLTENLGQVPRKKKMKRKKMPETVLIGTDDAISNLYSTDDLKTSILYFEGLLFNFELLIGDCKSSY